MARKTNKVCAEAIKIHAEQSKAIYESGLAGHLKVLVLKQLNISIETLLHRENCYHGFDYSHKSERWQRAINAQCWDVCRLLPEDYYHNYIIKGVEGDAHKQLDLI